VLTFSLFLIFEHSLSTLAIVVVFSFVIIYGYFFNRSTENIIRSNFSLKKAKTSLKELTNDLENKVREQTSDISEKNHNLQKQAHELVKDKKELIELDRMKDEFLQMATHELNTPITAIQGRLDMAVRENMCELTEKQKAFFQPVLDETLRLGRLSRDVLNVARIDQHRLSINAVETDLEVLIKQIISGLEIKIKEKGNSIVYLSKSSSLPRVTVDQSKIGEVLTNLINNANKFTDKGRIAVSTELKKDQIVVAVADSGIGIEEKDKKHLFEKFYQAGRFASQNPQEQQGSGLGLYISKNLVSLHGGTMWHESTKGLGSIFYFSLPREYKEISQKEKIHSDGTGLRVL
ncbi:MAG: HAMP domain-containing sensor histidine kinase, partial [bacterium]